MFKNLKDDYGSMLEVMEISNIDPSWRHPENKILAAAKNKNPFKTIKNLT